jgi:8-oxo-dGTP pyrophosphatase MutT (NUDIX family)
MLWLSNHFIDQLHQKMLQKLPGLPAQLKMAPPSRQQMMVANANAKLGGVMIVLYIKNNEWHLLLMRRTQDGGTHSGQISLPGGKYDAQDGSITYTAIRELHEEIGIAKEQITILGSLTPLYIPPSNFLITPIVCVWHTQSAMMPSDAEVQEILEIPLHTLYNTNTIQHEEVYRSDDKNIAMIAPLYKINEENKIWGATAMVLSELKELLHLNFDIDK